MSLALTPGNYTSLAVTGLVAGMVISDGNGHSQTATNPDQSIDLTGWTLRNAAAITPISIAAPTAIIRPPVACSKASASR